MDIEFTKEEASALRLLNIVFSKAIFPMLEGDDVTNLATARARIPGLANKISKYIAEKDTKTLETMAEKAAKKDLTPSEPIKKAE